MNLKITTLNLKSFSRNLLELKTNKSFTKNIKQNKSEILPLVSMPLVAYIVSPTAKKKLSENITNDAVNKITKNSTSTPISDRTAKNLQALKDAGVPQSERSKYIKSDGYMDNDGKVICRKNGVTSFTGSPQEVIDNPPEALFDPNDPDLMMDPKLEEIYNAPPIDTPHGLLNSIFGDLPSGFNMDMDLLGTLKGLAKDVFGDLLG